MAHRPSETSPLGEQVSDLLPGEQLQISGSSAAPRDTHTVKGCGQLEALNFNQKSHTFSPRGESYPFIELDDGILIHFRGIWGYFLTADDIALVGEEADQFNEPGEAFGKLGQKPGAVTFKWRDMTLTFQDEGYLVYRHGHGETLIPDGMMIKYFIAVDDKARLVYLENRKVGQDYVRVGTRIPDSDLSTFVGNVYREL